MVALSLRRTQILPAGSRIRVLVVDDSVVIRRLVTHALGEDDQVEVVGSASNGIIALQKIETLKPDAVTLDVEMPEMDGLETLKRLRKLYPDLPVIMFSTLTERGATATLNALALGANDYVTKAANTGSLDVSMASLRSELLPKVKQFFRIGAARESTKPHDSASLVAPENKFSAVPNKPVKIRNPSAVRRQIVAIGVSTGGPNALAEIMPMFPKNFGLPILIVQHMPPLFTRLLAERLNSISSIRVEEVTNGCAIEPGKALVAAGGYHMRVRKVEGKVKAMMDQAPPENSCRPAVDVMFRDVAEVYGAGAITVVLTGMGDDGRRGAEILASKGAYVIAQDEQSSVVWGMPGSVVKAGLADATVDLDSVVPEILKQI